MNLRTRRDIANKIAAIAQDNGATVETIDEPEYQETRVEARFAEVRFSIDIGGRSKALQSAILISWHYAQRRLNPAVFPSVNPHHGQKASLTAMTYESLYPELERQCKAIVSGEAFV